MDLPYAGHESFVAGLDYAANYRLPRGGPARAHALDRQCRIGDVHDVEFRVQRARLRVLPVAGLFLSAALHRHRPAPLLDWTMDRLSARVWRHGTERGVSAAGRAIHALLRAQAFPPNAVVVSSRRRIHVPPLFRDSEEYEPGLRHAF